MPATLQPSVKFESRTGIGTLRVGYVPLSDAAPLLVAEEQGFFRSRGLDVRLERELGWGSIREKLAYGELDAAHAPGGLMFSIMCGTHARPRAVRADVVLNLQGNAITLSRRLWQKGVHDGASLRLLLKSEAPRKPSFAVVSPFSSHVFLLRKWLTKAGIDPDRDVRVTVLPPPLVGEHMRAGLIDGFCVGEPWNSAAVFAGDGWIAATSAELEARHPEKVLIADDALARARSEEYEALIDAVVAACRFCESKAGRESVVDLFHSRSLFPVQRDVIANGLTGPLFKGDGLKPDPATFMYFHANEANRATRDRAVWLLDALGGMANLHLDAAQKRSCLEAFHDRMFEVAPAKTETRKKHK
ncbi:nitrate ABC transporter ATP-binding protein [Spartobacteria bacterium LR76]|nr:nitrate ABC transporter ATP-binding protein [Spartobacteria bacterium LR76]